MRIIVSSAIVTLDSSEYWYDIVGWQYFTYKAFIVMPQLGEIPSRLYGLNLEGCGSCAIFCATIAT